jgi:hypothetical protein
VFEERTFLPINLSGQGAMTIDDVNVLKTGYTVNIPRDKKNRTVIYIDNSRKGPDMLPSRRTIFFFGQCFMENEVSRCHDNSNQDGGFVILCNISNPFAANFIEANHQCMEDLIASCMPIRPHNVLLLHIAPPGISFMPLFINTGESFFVNVKSEER